MKSRKKYIIAFNLRKFITFEIPCLRFHFYVLERVYMESNNSSKINEKNYSKNFPRRKNQEGFILTYSNFYFYVAIIFYVHTHFYIYPYLKKYLIYF